MRTAREWRAGKDALHMKSRFLLFASLVVVLLMTYAASGHSGRQSAYEFHTGVQHPWSGLDHMVAMLAVGLWGVQLGGVMVWRLPLVFLAMMLTGAAVAGGETGVSPLVEHAIVASVLVLGLLLAVARHLPAWLAICIVGAAAIAHGHAHATDYALANGNSPAAYAMGFALSSALLLAAGAGIGILLRRHHAIVLVRFAGGAVAVCGVLLALRVL